MDINKLFLLACLAIFASGVFAQEELDPEEAALMEKYQQWSERDEVRGLAEPFRGLTIGGQRQDGLFAIRSTGVSTEPVRQAADNFLASLNEEQREESTFAIYDQEWRKWMNQHYYQRQGTYMRDMTVEQREAALGLMRASLSAKGMQLSRDIMRLNHSLAELNGDNFLEYGEWMYAITIMGQPSATEPWGWQVDGHHLAINYFVLGDQVVMTPSFFGSEPTIAESGKYEGLEILQEEQDNGLAFVRSLTEAQQQEAVLSNHSDGRNNLTEAFRDNVDLDYVGIQYSALNEQQKAVLIDLIGLYIGNMDEGHAAIKMEEVMDHLDNTWFAWIGGMADDSVFYYRIMSPVLLIEFDHFPPVGLTHLYPPKPMKKHIHIMIRTPNGNDYGKDLLRQHYQQYH